ncbi:MAG: MFS transporter [Armatimonadota bacterium]|nr:MFS transporter [Armatimonadota bacterium]
MAEAVVKVESDNRFSAEPDDASQSISPRQPPASTELPSTPTEEQLQADETRRFAALRHRNFRLFWAGNLISLIGTIAQQTAQNWLVRLLTDDPLTISIVAACGSLPILLLTLYAGVIADRVDKRRGLIATNFTLALLALVLATLVWLGVVQVWHLAVLSLFTGTVHAFDIPIRQSFNIEMVGRQDLPNAIALNSTAFNGARAIGPAVGGFLLHTIGMTGCFVLNALSFGAVITGLLLQRLPEHEVERRGISLDQFCEGFLFVRRHPTLWLVILLVALVSIFAISYGTLLSVFAKDVFHTDERGFSLIMTCYGLGAVGATFTLAASGQMRHKGKRLLLGAFLYCWSVAAFAAAPTLAIGCFFLIVSGWFLLTFLTTANTLVQTLSPDTMRGRVFSLYSLGLIGTAPIGALFIGATARLCGPRLAVQIGAVLAAACVFAVYWRFRSLWKEK